MNQSSIIQSICRCSANRLYKEEENDLFSLCIKDGTLKLETVLRTGIFTIVQNDFDLAVSLAKL